MKIKQYFKKKKYLMHLVLTIAGVVCIPLILAQLLMMELTTQGYFRMNEENIQEKLQERTAAFTRQIEDMSISAIKASQDAIIRKASKKSSSDYAVYEAAQRIQEYSTDDWTMGVWFYDSQSVIIDGVRITPEYLYEMLGGGDALCSDALREFFTTGEHMHVTSTANYKQGATGVIVAAMPVSFNISLSSKDMLVFFVMDQNVIIDDFSDKFYDFSGVMMLNQEGDILVKNVDFPTQLTEEAFKEFLRNQKQIKYSTTLSGERVSIYKYSDGAEYTCLVSMNEENMEIHLQKYVTNIRLFSVISMIIMILLLVLTVTINYRPIKRLTQRHEDKIESSELSELELLDSVFFAADQKILTMNRLLTNSIISDLLSGRPVDERQLQERGIDTDSLGTVVMVLNGPAITSVQSEEIVEAMRKQCGCDTYITGITYRPQIIMVCVLYQEIDAETLVAVTGELLLDTTGNEYDIHCGLPVEDLAEIRTSYLKLLTQSGENENSMSEMNNKIGEAIQRFGESLHGADAAKMQKRLDVVESLLTQANETEAFKKYYCYRLLTVYFANTKDSKLSKREMERLVNFEDSGQLFVMMKQSIRAVCAMMKESEGAAVNKLSKKLLDYVNENITDQNLCLTTAADYLGTSIYVVSRLFKETTGKGFKEYVTDKRLELARERLETTNMNVSEIAAVAGFENAVYFSNIFKSKYGLAPTLYRKKYQNE